MTQLTDIIELLNRIIVVLQEIERRLIQIEERIEDATPNPLDTPAS